MVQAGTKLFIRNMVCSRCCTVVEGELLHLGLEPIDVQLGEVTLKNQPTSKQLDLVKSALSKHGFEVIDDKKSRIINQIKKVVIEHIHHGEESRLKTNFSDFLASRLNQDYHYLSHLFSEVEGTTIEKYLINQRIEKAKELLVYDELSLAGIADKLGYSSTAHLSGQFKKVTGLTPSHFKTIGDAKRKPLDQV